MAIVSLRINGATHEVDIDPATWPEQLRVSRTSGS